MLLPDLIVCYLLFVSSVLSSQPVVNNCGLVVEKVGLEEITPLSVAIQFFVKLNNTGKSQCKVDLIPDICCVDVGHKMDCGVLNIIGQCTDDIPPGFSRDLKLIAPLLDPFNRKGHCNVYTDSKPVGGKRALREVVKIQFDTRLKSIDPQQLPPSVQPCEKIDQDPLNRCEPVYCPRYYNGRKSYFNKIDQKCVEVPLCIAEVNTEMPKSIYDPVNNKCIEDTPITRKDVAYIKSLMGVSRKTKEVLILGNYISDHKQPAKDSRVKELREKFIKIKTTKKPTEQKIERKTEYKTENITGNYTGYKQFFSNSPYFQNAAFVYVMNNRWCYLSLISLIFLQCLIICTLVCSQGPKCCCTKKKLIRKYYNFRQDATITTPLIGTSKDETSTTDYQYLSESSNVEKTIKKYKSCNKQKAEAKISMSDDIISKYLNRRDWRHAGPKSEAIYDYATKDSNEKPEVKESPRKKEERQQKLGQTKKRDPVTMTKTKEGEVRINFMNEDVNKTRKQGKVGISTKKKAERKSPKMNEPKKRNTIKLNDSSMLFSEQDITIRNYNYKIKNHRTIRSLNDSDAQSEQELNCHSYSWDMDEGHEGSMPSNYEGDNFTSQYSGTPERHQVTKALSTASIEKSALNSFPTESIDDLLSERAMLLHAGDNASKYSFSTGSNKVSSMSDKTSKNNIVRNMLAMFQKKQKQGPSSYPGAKKTKESFDLKVIHMSSVLNNYSSNENGMKDARDSRSST